ncbi:hypothetical protein AAF134_02095 [Synechococcus lacustris Tous-12m]
MRITNASLSVVVANFLFAAAFQSLGSYLFAANANAQTVICKSTGRGSSGLVKSGIINYSESSNSEARFCYYKDKALVIEQDAPGQGDKLQFAIAGYCKPGGSSISKQGRISLQDQFSLWNAASRATGC